MDPAEMANDKTHPIFIGIGCTLEKKTRWYIKVEESIITVSALL